MNGVNRFVVGLALLAGMSTAALAGEVDTASALLFRAWDQDDEAQARVLLDRGARADADNVHGRSVYHLLLAAGEDERLLDWLARSGQADVLDAHGHTLLHTALAAEAWSLVPRLLEQGVPMDAGALIDRAPVKDVITLLPTADLLPADALHRAAARGDATLVSHLLALGTDPFAEDAAGYWPAWHAILYGHDAALQALVAAMPAPGFAQARDGAVHLDMGAPRVRWWSLLLWAGRHEALLDDLRGHLAEDTVHPLAAYTWARTHFLRGTLAAALEDDRVPEQPRRLARLEQAYRDGDTRAVLDMMPPGSDALAQSDPFTLDALMRSALQQGDDAALWHYTAAALQRWPDSWQMLWSLEDRLLQAPAWRDRVVALAADNALAGTPMAQGLDRRLNGAAWESEDTLQAARDWLQQAPNDVRALHAAGSLLLTAGHEQQAADPLARAVLLYPFFSNRDSLPRVFVDDRERVARVTALMARWYQHPDDSAVLIALRAHRYHADACRAGGDHGCAMAQLAQLQNVLDAQRDALVASPGGAAEMRLAYGALSREAARRHDTAHSRELAREAFALSDGGPAARATLARALDPAVQPAAVRALLDEVAEAVRLEHRELAELWLEVLLAEQAPAAQGWLTQLRQRYPDDVALQRREATLAIQRGDRSATAPAMLRLHRRRQLTDTLLQAWLDSSDGAAARDALRGYLIDTPTQSFYWRQGAAIFGDQVLTQAQQAFPHQVWPWADQFEALMNAGDLEAARTLLDNTKTPVLSHADLSPSTHKSWHDNHYWWLAETVRRGRADPDQLREGLAGLDLYLQAGWWRGTWNHYRDILLEGLGDNDARAHNLRDWAGWQRDSTDILWRLVRLGDTRHDAALYGGRMVARQPDNNSAWREHVQSLIYWLGRPVFGLYRAEQARALGHDIPDDFVARARAQVGDNLSDFLGYRHNTAVSPSQRYVDWFNSARRNALSGDARRVYTRFDGDIPAVEILLPNGEVQTQQVDPRHGMVIRATHGSATAEADYDALGQLLAVRLGGVETLRLEYNSARQIVAAKTGEQQLAIAYNDAGKPARIHVRGLGEISVEYDEQGDILRVVSDAGQAMALQVTQIFQQLLASVRTVSRFSDPRELRVLAEDDPVPGRWRAYVYAQAPGSLAQQAARLAEAGYLAGARTRRSEYGEQAAQRLLQLFDDTAHHDAPADRATALLAVQAWAQLHQSMRPRGLNDDEYATWSQMRLWLANTPHLPAQRRAALRDTPLARLEDRHALQRTALANDGYWHRYSRREIHGNRHEAPRHQALLVRDNGEVLLGTSHGLFVLRQGYWQRYGYDAASDRLVRGSDALDPAPERDILALAETPEGLWLGTASGLMLWHADGRVQHWRSTRDGLPSPRVTALLAADDGSLWVGTAAGLTLWAEGRLAVPASAPTRPVHHLVWHGGQPVVNTDTGLRVLTAAGGWAAVPGAPGRAVEAVLADPARGRLLWLDADGLHAQAGEARAQRLLPRDDIPHSRRIHGLTLWPLPLAAQTTGEVHPVILTDTGLALLRNHYLETLPLPLAGQRGGRVLGPQQAAGNGRDIWLVAADGVYGWQAGQVSHHALGVVRDMTTDPDGAMAWIAADSGIHLLTEQAGVPHLSRFSRDRAQVVRSDGAGGLYTHDDWDILHYPAGATRPHILFSAEGGHARAHWNGPVRDMLAASDGSLWVVSGATLFRWQQDTLTRFDYLDDPERFPSRSLMLFRVYETLDGEIHVVASNEGHLAEAGVYLRGGLLRLEGDRFVNLGQPPHWFVKAYTPVSERLAILGTAGAFVRERWGSHGSDRDSYVRLEDPGYLAMGERASMLFLGGRGARLGHSDTWLFPSAGGVTAWQDGEWFYPDRLNQLLPDDQALGQYGARTVHAVAVVGEGLVLAGTDLGLLVYPAGSAAGLLSDHQRGARAFVSQQQSQQQAVADTFLEALAGQRHAQRHPAARQVNAIRRLGQDIDQLDAALITPLLPARSGQADGPAVDHEALRRELRERERQREQLLAELEREHRGLFQMLRLDPREASVLGSDLAPGQVLVQYLPTPDRLLIHVVSRDGAVLREVQVPADQLTQRSLRVAAGLRDAVYRLPGEVQPLRSLAHRRTRSVADPAMADALLQEDLAWLYEQLLRPVEQELAEASQVFVTPVGALTYLPFPALRRVQPDGRGEYAVQRFNLGVLPSLYHLNLVLREDRSASQAALFIADPDGSLPGARAEVEAVSALLPGRVLRGNEALPAALDEAARGARILHFATHGVLDPQAPAESYLVMGHGERLTTIDISLLDLTDTDLVVLSACESGVGINGLEYATLARAFAHARVPSVIASYWQVSDTATRALMERLYPRLRDQGDVYTALAAAQRDMLAAGEGHAHPAAWSGFAAFGRP
ncbi:CHAT domain-containing protein [Isoalcanivorax indicus]|uniref:CHAT domain-containing protein n=1 Tax=Isoalcanivorax indicus TaxID=2202653 RepID=UPI000DB94277|nr:CHAT domain-containing protein [Isoalcanivorax indicus]